MKDLDIKIQKLVKLIETKGSNCGDATTECYLCEFYRYKNEGKVDPRFTCITSQWTNEKTYEEAINALRKISPSKIMEVLL